MACPRCGSSDMWDDNMWGGCNDCGYACSMETGPTMAFAKPSSTLPNVTREYLKDLNELQRKHKMLQNRK